MMRPMKLAGSELIFGKNSLEYIKTIKGKKAFIVTSSGSMKKSGALDKVLYYLKETNIETSVFSGVDPDPFFSTVLKGASELLKFNADMIIALGGGSVMDAAKAMWVCYENTEIKELKDLLPPHTFPKLRKKAILVCIPSTAGTASEVSRSVVITDDKTDRKIGIGNMEMMPDIAICDPLITLSMPKHITAETGMDALTHALEAYVSNRSNYLSDILSESAIKDIVTYLPKAYDEGSDIEYREKMLLASMVAGLAFTNVSLGIAHSISQTLGGYFHLSHGLLNAVILPYVINYNMKDSEAQKKYKRISDIVREDDIVKMIFNMNKKFGIASSLQSFINDDKKYFDNIEEMAELSLKDGCTKTNPIIPSIDDFKNILETLYYGEK